MARKFLGIRVCDICGADGDDVVPRWFAIGDRRIREADLCDREWRRLQKQLAPFLAVARTPGRKPSQTGITRLPHASPMAARIRSWAREHGYDVLPRGPLPKNVISAYYDEPGREEADRQWLAEQQGPPKRPGPPKGQKYPPCGICGDPSVARGMCWTHLKRWYRQAAGSSDSGSPASS